MVLKNRTPAFPKSAAPRRLRFVLYAWTVAYLCKKNTFYFLFLPQFPHNFPNNNIFPQNWQKGLNWVGRPYVPKCCSVRARQGSQNTPTPQAMHCASPKPAEHKSMSAEPRVFAGPLTPYHIISLSPRHNITRSTSQSTLSSTLARPFRRTA